MDPHMGNHGNGTDAVGVTVVIPGRSTLGCFLQGGTSDSFHGGSRVKVTEPAFNRWSKMAPVAFCVWILIKGSRLHPGLDPHWHSSQDLGTHHLSFLDFLFISLLPLSFFSSPSGARAKWLLAVPNHMFWFSIPSDVISSVQYEGINFQKVPVLLHSWSGNTIPFPCRNRVPWQSRMRHVCGRHKEREWRLLEGKGG